VAAGRFHIKGAVIMLAAVGLVARAAFQLSHGRVETAFQQKAYIAETNVEERFIFWRIAVREFSTSPVLGVGPGNFEVRLVDFDRPAHLYGGTFATHNTYLQVLAELGLPGAAVFAG